MWKFRKVTKARKILSMDTFLSQIKILIFSTTVINEYLLKDQQIASTDRGQNPIHQITVQYNDVLADTRS